MDASIESSPNRNEETLKGRFMTFQAGQETYGIEIRYVIEIVGLQPLTIMPEMPEYIKGIINLRGRVIPVMDVRLRFGMQWREYDDRTCIIVVDLNGVPMGLVIDSVSEVIAISDSELIVKPKMSGRESCGYVKCLGNVGNQVILLIDCQKLLSFEECSCIVERMA